MKRFLIPVMAALLSTAAVTQVGYTQTSTPGAHAQAFRAHVLSRTELDALLTKPTGVLFIDVRRPDEISKIGSLPVYLNVQLSELEKSIAWIPHGRTIVTLSNHAVRAGKAADFLQSKGFKVAGAVGVQTYEQQGGTLTKVAIPPPKTAAVSHQQPAH